MRATVEGDSPPSTSPTARRRRRSSSGAVPIGLVIPHYTDVQTSRQAMATPESVGGAEGSGELYHWPLQKRRVLQTASQAGQGEQLGDQRRPSPTSLARTGGRAAGQPHQSARA